MRTKLPSSWKGYGTQEGVGEREQVTLREGTVLFREGKGKLMGEQLEQRESDRRLDLELQDTSRSTICWKCQSVTCSDFILLNI